MKIAVRQNWPDLQFLNWATTIETRKSSMLDLCEVPKKIKIAVTQSWSFLYFISWTNTMEPRNPDKECVGFVWGPKGSQAVAEWPEPGWSDLMSPDTTRPES